MKIIEFLPTEEKSVVDRRNWVYILDFSGSMGWTLDPLAQHVMTEIRKVPVGDTVTIGWFSGVGYFGWIVKGSQIIGQESYEIIDRMIQGNLYTRNTTCFSEILKDVDQVVKDLSAFSDVFNLLFFTDGCPVVPSVTAEVTAVEKAITAIASRLSAALFIGYGNYYNRELMKDMAGWAGGALVHSRDLNTTQQQVDDFMIDGLVSAGRVEIVLDEDAELAFALNGNQVVTLNIPASFIVSAPIGTKVWAITKEIKGGNIPAVDITAKYAAAAALTREGQLGQAMEILGEIGDVHLIDRLDSAFTLDDIGETEAEIVRAVVDEDVRFQKGKVANYVPPADAFCLLDVLDMLMNDPIAKFYPQDKRWKYQRIGPKMKKENKYPRFRPDNDGCDLNTLMWSSKALNLSVLAKTNGTILLGQGAAKYRLPGAFPTHKWNNYALISDGRCNVPVVPMSFSKETYDMLKVHGMVIEDWVDESTIYAVDMTKVPVMNRAIAEGYKKAEDVVRLVIEGYKLRARLKVLGYYYNEATAGKKVVSIKGYNEEQSKFLDTKGIDKSGAYSPHREKVKPVDFIEVNQFEIKVKGLSSLPKVKAVLDRIEAIKKDETGKKGHTTSTQLIADALAWYSNLTLCYADNQKLAEQLDVLKTTVRSEIRKLDAQVARAKFAVILGKAWFEDVDRSEPTIEVDGYTATFAESKKRVDL
jgi:hypothetical protein